MAPNSFGFLTKFEIGTGTAKDRVRFLFHDSGITNFIFYDCMERYERPIPDKKEWEAPLGRCIKENTIDAYIEEITILGGKSWFYAPIYSVSPGYQTPGLERALFTFQNGKFVQDWHCVDNNPIYALVDPSTESWKKYYTEQLRKTTEKGFTGIFFDQYGSLENRAKFRYKLDIWSFDHESKPECFEEIDKRKLMAEFLQYFKQNNAGIGVLFNAVDGYGFEETKNIVDLPYLELWSDELIEYYCSKLNGKKFVIAAYPNDKKIDWAVFEKRKKLINGAGGSFLFKGDDNRYLISCYFPEAVKFD